MSHKTAIKVYEIASYVLILGATALYFWLKQQGLKLNIAPDVAQGTYSNLVVISHTPAEVVLDFAQMLPGTEGATIRQRIIMNPIHAKRTLAALNDNIKKYEQQFGTISEPRMPMQSDTVPYDIIGKA